MLQHVLAIAYQDDGQLAKALPLFEHTVEKDKAQLGHEHPSTLNAMNNLASAHQDAGQLDKAVLLFERTLEQKKARLGYDRNSARP